jgi:hypothetical protein
MNQNIGEKGKRKSGKFIYLSIYLSIYLFIYHFMLEDLLLLTS